MPNKWNYSFDNYYAALLVLGIYVPGEWIYNPSIFNACFRVSFLRFLIEFAWTLQGVRTCITTCLDRGRRSSLDPRKIDVKALCPIGRILSLRFWSVCCSIAPSHWVIEQQYGIIFVVQGNLDFVILKFLLFNCMIICILYYKIWM